MRSTLLLRNGLVIDGSRFPGYLTDVLIDGERIVHIGTIAADSATEP